MGVGGVTLVDVTNPRAPKKLVEGFGDFTVKGKSQTHSNQVHSAFGWINNETGRAYVVMTDDEEATDTDIIEITNPSRPTFVAEYDFAPQSRQPLGAVHGDAVFIHDEVVKKIGGRYVGLLSYWDGGYIQVDLTNPASPVYLGDTEFPGRRPRPPPAHRHVAVPGGQRPPGRVHPGQPVLPRHRRGLQSPAHDGHHHRRALRRDGVHRSSRAITYRRSMRTRR